MVLRKTDGNEQGQICRDKFRNIAKPHSRTKNSVNNVANSRIDHESRQSTQKKEKYK